MRVEREAGRVHEVWAKGGRVLEARTLNREGLTVRRYERAAVHLAKRVSPRVMRWLDTLPMFRDPEATCSSETLIAELERHGVSVWASLLQIEECVGGLMAYDPQDPARIPRSETRLGAYRVLQEEIGIDDEDAEDSLFFEPGAWPVVHREGRPLVLVGKVFGSTHLYANESGSIFSFRYEFDDLSVSADDVVHYLEKLALQWEMSLAMPDWSPAELNADIAAALASALGLRRVEEASDGVSVHWKGDGIWVRSERKLLPKASSFVATLISTRTAEEMVEAVQRARALAPAASLLVHSSTGPRRYDALKEAGFDVQRP